MNIILHETRDGMPLRELAAGATFKMGDGEYYIVVQPWSREQRLTVDPNSIPVLRLKTSTITGINRDHTVRPCAIDMLMGD